MQVLACQGNKWLKGRHAWRCSKSSCRNGCWASRCICMHCIQMRASDPCNCYSVFCLLSLSLLDLRTCRHACACASKVAHVKMIGAILHCALLLLSFCRSSARGIVLNHVARLSLFCACSLACACQCTIVIVLLHACLVRDVALQMLLESSMTSMFTHACSLITLVPLACLVKHLALHVPWPVQAMCTVNGSAIAVVSSMAGQLRRWSKVLLSAYNDAIRT